MFFSSLVCYDSYVLWYFLCLTSDQLQPVIFLEPEPLFLFNLTLINTSTSAHPVTHYFKTICYLILNLFLFKHIHLKPSTNCCVTTVGLSFPSPASGLCRWVETHFVVTNGFPMLHAHQPISINFFKLFSDARLFQFQTVVPPYNMRDNPNSLSLDSYPLGVTFWENCLSAWLSSQLSALITLLYNDSRTKLSIFSTWWSLWVDTVYYNKRNLQCYVPTNPYLYTTSLSYLMMHDYSNVKPLFLLTACETTLTISLLTRIPSK